MRRLYWDYYRAIEDDLIVASRYVEFAEANYSCNSVEFARLLLAAGSELDMVFKILCQKIRPSSKAGSIGEYHAEVTARFPDLTAVKRYVRRFELELEPFAGWTKNDPPCWWTCGFNKIKHKRDTFFHFATLKNTLDAVAALQVVLFHLYSLQENRPVGKFEISDLPPLIVQLVSGDRDRDAISVKMNFLH